MKKLIKKNILLLFFPFIIGCALILSCTAKRELQSNNITNTARFHILEKIPIEPIWSGTHVGYSLMTIGNQQFAAYYDANKQMTVAQRSLDSKEWITKKLDSYVGWDSHNYITMAFDSEGYLHVSGNMHVVPLIYFRASKPYDVTTLEQILSMTGKKENRMTYPNFFKNKNNELIFRYRDGSSGDGNDFYNIYDTTTKKWRRLLELPLTDGEGLMNAYCHGPVEGPDGWFHMSWVWRDTPAAETNHDLSYAKSPDMINWFTADGTPVPLPIKLNTPGVVVDPIPIKCGIINGSGVIGFDSKGRVILSYHKFEDCTNPNSPSQFYNTRLEDGKWKIYQTTNWNYRWYFEGGGSLPAELRIGRVYNSNEELRQSFTYTGKGSAIFILSEETLKPIDMVASTPWPDAVLKLHSTFPKMKVNIIGGSGDTKNGEQYIMRYETLPANRDQAYPGPWPEPGMLEVYKLKLEKNF